MEPSEPPKPSEQYRSLRGHPRIPPQKLGGTDSSPTRADPSVTVAIIPAPQAPSSLTSPALPLQPWRLSQIPLGPLNCQHPCCHPSSWHSQGPLNYLNLRELLTSQIPRGSPDSPGWEHHPGGFLSHPVPALASSEDAPSRRGEALILITGMESSQHDPTEMQAAFVYFNTPPDMCGLHSGTRRPLYRLAPYVIAHFSYCLRSPHPPHQNRGLDSLQTTLDLLSNQITTITGSTLTRV
ncbi:hypothetical protein E1301_Tti000717 [Triplophysa tibetana]|uniref:Uncharacterized protein n=1 Tax=Triplophysa tibetana TaxID=1572043 RepID=A0A5A9N6X4_9TELE|nr:hypothetical protein E1301_Tti000717 [Triplophysa tibetana]